jgi:ATP-dependent Zn protease
MKVRVGWALAHHPGSGYLGGQVAMRNLSSDIENLVDAEIRRLLDSAQETATELLTTHEKALREIARVLQEDEVIDGETVSKIVATSSSK